MELDGSWKGQKSSFENQRGSDAGESHQFFTAVSERISQPGMFGSLSVLSSLSISQHYLLICGLRLITFGENCNSIDIVTRHRPKSSHQYSIIQHTFGTGSTGLKAIDYILGMIG